MIKRFILAGIFLILVFGGVIGFKLYKQSAMRDYLSTMPATTVRVNGTIAKGDTWEQRLPFIGSLRSQKGIDIRNEVEGVVVKLHVESGALVNAGDVLVELDDTVDQAVLKSAKVRQAQTRRDFERDRSLFERGLVSEDKFDNSRSEYESAQALVEETLGIIDKKTITAPFSGTLGIHNLAPGNYLEAGDEIVSLQSLDALYLDFNLPEKELDSVRPGQTVSFTVPSHGNRDFEGKIQYLDVQVQTTTRNILIRARVANPDLALTPGMFANGVVVLDSALDVISLPREAVAFSLYGETVFVLEKSGSASTQHSGWTARRQSVKTGDIRLGYVAVEGLVEGQLVALDTQHRLLEGTPVKIENLDSLESGLGAGFDSGVVVEDSFDSVKSPPAADQSPGLGDSAGTGEASGPVEDAIAEGILSAEGSLNEAEDSLWAEGSFPTEESLSAENSLPIEDSLFAEGSLSAEGSAPAEDSSQAEGAAPAEGFSPAEGSSSAEGSLIKAEDAPNPVMDLEAPVLETE